MMANFVSLGLTARMALLLVAQQVEKAKVMQFVASAEAVEVSFVEEEEMIAAITKGMLVKGIEIPLVRCPRWDPRAWRLVIEGVPTWSRQETKV